MDKRTPRAWTPKEIIERMDADDNLAKVRKLFYHRSARIHQILEQDRTLSPIAVRRMEFEAALEILDALGVEP